MFLRSTTFTNTRAGWLGQSRAGGVCCCRYGMFAPGCVALAVSVLVLIFFKDTPESSGFPAIDAGSKKPVAKDTSEASGVLSRSDWLGL